MDLGIKKFGWNTASDFRAKATFGVAIAALTLLLPVAFLDFYLGKTAIGIGSLGIVFILGVNAWVVKQGNCHQNLTLFGLIPAGMVFMIGVFHNDGYIGALWCFPSIVAVYCMLSQRKAWIANAIVLGIALPMVWQTVDTEYAIRITATMAAISLFSAILVSVIDEQCRQLQELVTRDPLTHLLNRHTLKISLQSAMQSQVQGLYNSTLLAIDIDFFKQINDTHGHDCGDEILRELSALMQTVLRHDDVAFRIGGEEFLVILNFTDEIAAIEVGERVRRTVEAHEFYNNCKVTVSVGIAGHISGESSSSWTKRADDRLYVAKRSGRNCVVAYDSIKPALATIRSFPTLVR